MTSTETASDVAPAPSVDEERLRRFEQRMAYPLLLSAVAPILLGSSDGWIANAILVGTWLVFLVDLVVHVRLRPNYLRTNAGRFDLAIVVLTAPWFLIPGLGESRFLVLARLGRLARLAVGSKGGRRAFQRVGKVGIFAGSMVAIAALVVFKAERATNAEFDSFGDALWWAVVTITTVGYGDKVPESTTGQLAATSLMVTGIAILGVLAGILAELFRLAPASAPVPDEPASPSTSPDVAAELSALREQLTSLERLLREQGTGSTPPPDH